MDRNYTTVSGHVIRLDDASADTMRFLDRLERQQGDPRATEAEMIGLAYSRENPFLDHALFPQRGSVTREVLERPEYHAMADMLARKRLAHDHVDVEALANEHALSVAEVAARLGVNDSAVRQAIATRRLPSWVKNGQHFMRPDAVAAFEVGTRGPKPKDRVRPTPLEVCVGNREGTSFRVRYPGDLADEERVAAHVVAGRVAAWRRVAIIFGGEGRHRFFVIEPDEQENEVKLGPFYARGKFKIVEKVNNEIAARNAWKSFKAA